MRNGSASSYCFFLSGLVIVIRAPDGLEGLLQRRGARGRRPAGA